MPWRLLVPLFSAYFLIFLGPGAFQQFLMRYLREAVGLSGAAPGAAWATVYIVMTGAAFLPARVARRLDDRAAIALGASTYPLFLGLILWLRRPFVPFLAAALWGVGAATLWVVSSLVVVERSPEGRVGLLSGSLNAVARGGFAVGGVLLSQLIASHGIERALEVAFLFGLAGALFAWAMPPFRGDHELPGPAGVARFLRLSSAKAGAFFQFTAACSFGALLGAFAEMVGSLHGVRWVGPVTSAYLVLSVVGAVFGGGMCDLLGVRAALTAAYGLGAVGVALPLLGPSVPAMAAGSGLLGVLSGTVPTAIMVMVREEAREGERMTAMVAFHIPRTSGMAASILFSGLLLGLEVAPGRILACFGALFALCALLSALFVKGRVTSSRPGPRSPR